jgi:hypothetical protein
MKRLATLSIWTLALFVGFLGVLALDLAWRVWVTRAVFDPGDAGMLLTLESTRAAATFALVAIALAALRGREPGSAAFAAFLLFVGMWYAKTTAYGFPGFLQERIAGGLVEAGVPHRLLRVLFGEPGWALPPALAAFLAFAMRYPAPPVAADVRETHATGRRGTFRDVALAGTDVRSFVHRAAAATLERGWWHPATLASGAFAGAVAMLAGGALARGIVLAVMTAVGAFACAFLRTAWLRSEGEARTRLASLGRAGLAASIGVLAGGALAFVPGETVARMTMTVATAAPLGAAVLLIGFARSDPPPRAASHG